MAEGRASCQSDLDAVSNMQSDPFASSPALGSTLMHTGLSECGRVL